MRLLPNYLFGLIAQFKIQTKEKFSITCTQTKSRVINLLLEHLMILYYRTMQCDTIWNILLTHSSARMIVCINNVSWLFSTSYMKFDIRKWIGKGYYHSFQLRYDLSNDLHENIYDVLWIIEISLFHMKNCNLIKYPCLFLNYLFLLSSEKN